MFSLEFNEYQEAAVSDMYWPAAIARLRSASTANNDGRRTRAGYRRRSSSRYSLYFVWLDLWYGTGKFTRFHFSTTFVVVSVIS